MSQDRQPKGIKRGGQFRSVGHPEPDVDLQLEAQVISANLASWPRTTYEERSTDSASNTGTTTRHQRIIPPVNYFAAMAPEISDLTFIPLPPDVAVLTADASAEIARFDQEIGAEIGNFTAILLRSESSSSSELEQLTATADEIALAEMGDAAANSNAQMIAMNTAAMRRAIELSDCIDEESIIAMHEVLLSRHYPEWTGKWRTQQVRIGGATLNTARFVPPHPDRVPAAMSDLVRFIQRDDLPTFEQAAVAHAHFETIHPFPDGNGRTGRSLVHAMLKRQGLTRFVTVPVSAGLLSEPEIYFDALTQYRKGNHIDIIRLMAYASFDAIDNGRHLAHDLRIAKGRWQENLKVRSDAASRRLLDVLVQQPAVDVAFVQRELSITNSSAENAIRQLVDIGVLVPVDESRRNRRWVASDVTGALDAFAMRAKRRRLA